MSTEACNYLLKSIKIGLIASIFLIVSNVHFIFLDVATSTFFNTDQSKIEYRKQILLRLTTIGGDSAHNGTNAPDKLPPNLHVIVNSRAVPLPQPKPTAKPNSDVIRPGI